MKIGVPREIKNHEYRVGLVPDAVRALVAAGHQLIVERGAGAGIGFSDSDYAAAGASIAQSGEETFRGAELVVKVKEPQLEECRRLTRDQVLFTYLHLAADRAQAEALVASGCTAIAYETVAAPDGSLPLLTPMSEVAGRMPCRWARSTAPRHSAGEAFCSAAYRGWRRHASSWWAGASRAATPRRWQWACAPMSPSSNSRCRDCASSTSISRGARACCCLRRARSRPRSRARTC